jgi:non-ribosomal peptide synthetase component F
VHALRRTAQVEFAACLLAVLRLAVHALTSIDELCVGMPVNLRNSSAQEAGVGYFVNLLVLRERITPGMDKVALLRQVQRNLSEALCHRSAALPELARQLQPRLLPSGNPWCDVLFAYQNLPWDLPRFTGLDAAVERLTLDGQYPLKVEFIPAGATCLCRIEYAREVLTPAAVGALHSAIHDQLASLSAPLRSN